MGEVLVEAIKEGEIVRMSESQAKAEELFILRRLEPLSAEKSSLSVMNALPVKVKEPSRLDKWKREVDYQKNNVLSELIENFHWEVIRLRRSRNMSRLQLAHAIGEREDKIKVVEQGGLPEDNFALINKIQRYFGVNLRKDGKKFDDSPRAMMSSNTVVVEKEKKEEKKEEKTSVFGDDIEIIE